MKFLHPNFPFNPNRSPFFYGYIIVFICSFGAIASIPGQTIGMSVFTEHLIEHLGLSRISLTTAYMLGTIAGSLLVTKSGKFYDKHGGRVSLMLTCFLFGLSLIIMSQIDKVNTFLFEGWLVHTNWSMFALTLVGYSSIRFLGQGTLMVITRSLLMEWFEKRRGLANGIAGVFISISFSSSPFVLNQGILSFGWRGTWLYVGLFLMIPVVFFFWVFTRDRPEDHGLRPDGVSNQAYEEKATPQVPSRTLAEARKTLEFWTYTLALSLLGMYITAYAFNLFSIYENFSEDPQLGVFLFLPSSILSIVTNLLGGYLTDRFSIKYALYSLLVSIGVGIYGVMRLGHPEAPFLIVLGNGVASGHFAILSTTVWPKYFGRGHLGAINGLTMSVLMFASALGPIFFAFVHALSGSYSMALGLCIIIVLLLFIPSVLVKAPSKII